MPKLRAYWKAKFERRAREMFYKILSELAEEDDAYGNELIFPWVDNHTFDLMARAASIVLMAMMEQENYLAREGYMVDE